RDEDAGREPAAKELLRHLPIARPPKWPRTLHRADREVGGYADAEAEPSTKTVLEVAKQQGLLGRRQRPERDVVAKPRHREEPRQPHKCAMPVEVVARFHRSLPAQMIDERLVGGKLVHVAEQPVKTDVETGARGSDDVEPLRRTELARDAGDVDRVLRRRGIGRRPAGVLLRIQPERENREQTYGKCERTPHRRPLWSKDPWFTVC